MFYCYLEPNTNMHKLNVLLSRKDNALARLRNAGDNIAHSKECLRLAILNSAVGSTRHKFWQSELARHDAEWREVCEELREINWELGNK